MHWEQEQEIVWISNQLYHVTKVLKYFSLSRSTNLMFVVLKEACTDQFWVFYIVHKPLTPLLSTLMLKSFWRTLFQKNPLLKSIWKGSKNTFYSIWSELHCTLYFSGVIRQNKSNISLQYKVINEPFVQISISGARIW